MNTYECFFKLRRLTVEAESSFAAQVKAAALFHAKRRHEVIVILAGAPVSTALLPGA